ncbi:hypothetical protein SAMN02910289_00866 [Lachnospiraceae bacterium RM5]|nr:hypothetical protein SAMN02910289_00866 [Lachnospiraceae bacterium RM5]
MEEMKKNDHDVSVAVEDEKEENKKDLLKIIKTGLTLLVCIIIAILAAIAWFSMNKETGASGMEVKTVASPFELRTSGSAGLYDNYITTIDSGYSTGSETGGSNGQKIIWQLTAQNQMENLWNGEGTPTAEEMRKIQKLESDAYGLSPGAYGQLTFTIVPKNDAGLTAKIKPQVTCYKTTYDSDGYQSGTITAMDEENADDAEAMKFLSGHIRFYYKYDSNDDGVDEMHLITDTFSVEDITRDTNVTIYWVWPNRLNNILELNVEGLDSTANTELRKYFFTNPSIFLATTSSDSSTVFDSITLGSNATDEQITAAVSSITSPASTYSGWSGRYNSADQTIGDKVGYIMLEVQVEPDGTN